MMFYGGFMMLSCHFPVVLWLFYDGLDVVSWCEWGFVGWSFKRIWTWFLVVWLELSYF